MGRFDRIATLALKMAKGELFRKINQSEFVFDLCHSVIHLSRSEQEQLRAIYFYNQNILRKYNTVTFSKKKK